jgi:mono/diheme cytochrome c family protein
MKSIILALWMVAALVAMPVSCKGPNRGTGKNPSGAGAGQTSGTQGAGTLQTGPGAGTQNALGQEIKRGNDAYIAAGCGKCHKIGDEGGSAGPDLTRIGARRTKDEIGSEIRSPAVLNPNTIMPTADLTDQQIEDLAQYLSMLR